MTETSTYTHQELSARLAEVERERDELAAMVGRTSRALVAAHSLLSGHRKYPDTPEYDLIRAVLSETPPTALAEIRAEAATEQQLIDAQRSQGAGVHPQPAQQAPQPTTKETTL